MTCDHPLADQYWGDKETEEGAKCLKCGKVMNTYFDPGPKGGRAIGTCLEYVDRVRWYKTQEGLLISVVSDEGLEVIRPCDPQYDYVGIETDHFDFIVKRDGWTLLKDTGAPQ